jgi:serine/threonine protein kinase/Tfp pilus assembly protein PilF
MTPAQLQKIKEIFHGALDCQPDKVSAFLEAACQGDEVLRYEVDAVLTAHRHAGNFIEAPVAGLATNIIEKGQAGLLVGQTIGHYKISEAIGTGGMGEVYLATDIVAGRKAALKLLPLQFTGDAERLKRFQHEAHAVVGLNHPNILTVYEIGEDHSIHYIASELIEGETLRQRLTRGSMQLSEAVNVAIQVASALAAAHQAGIVHRDIKPENIMLRPDEYVKVLDFGIAKLAEQELPATMPRDEALLLVETNLGSILGTVRYMSPEQACGAQVDNSTDIWSLGVVLYEMVTRQTPFTGDTPAEVMSAILKNKPPPLTRSVVHAPAVLQQIVTKTLRKDRNERYHSAHELLEALKNLRHKLEVESELQRSSAVPLWLRRVQSPVALVLILLVAALALAFPFYWHRNPTTTSPPERSIAVLPFENLSPDPQNAYFADGVQDELLTDLARIADLKVIGRTSVMPYKSGVARNLRKIGHELGVAHLVEGSVERSGNRVRVNAQLVDARTDRRLWGQTYDRDLADVFAIQSEIAKRIAEQLQAKLSPAEESAIAQALTTDVTAFDLYTRTRNLFLSHLGATNKANSLQTVDLLNQAVTRDPSFFQAYCDLADAHDILYFSGYDHTSARLALAEAAIQAASRVRPDAGELHLARAQNLYHGYLDYDGALAELELARQSLPNLPGIFELTGFIQRRLGSWEESTRNLERALQLDPRNLRTLQETALSYQYCRHYDREKSLLDRVLSVVPNDVATKAARAFVEFDSKADTRPLHDVIDSVAAKQPGTLSSAASYWLMCALGERDAAAANTALIALGENPAYLGVSDNVVFNRAFVEGVIARVTNQDEKARLAFTAARAEQEKVVQADPNYAQAMCVLGLIDAALGRKEEALREGQRAVELLPVEKDALGGNMMIKYFAMIAAWVGDKDLACEQLASAIRRPSDLSYGQLKLLPYWDPLRGDPRFEKIVEDAKQPVALK